MFDNHAVWAALLTIIHHTLGLSLVRRQMVKAARVDGDAFTVELLLDCPGCPGAEAALAEMRRNWKF